MIANTGKSWSFLFSASGRILARWKEREKNTDIKSLNINFPKFLNVLTKLLIIEHQIGYVATLTPHP